MKFSVTIIGLGSIGMGYDQRLPIETHILSHARAFNRHTGFDLVGGVDPEPKKQEVFTQTYKAPAYASTAELLKSCKPDVIVVANPTEQHHAIIEEILVCHKPKAIFCEKPLGYNVGSSRLIVDACNNNEVPLFVNFIRRADPGVQEIKRRFVTGLIKSPLKAVVWYSKGLLHNGSHFVDLLSFWLGPIRDVKIIHSGHSLVCHDAEPDVRIEFDHGSAVFCSAWEEYFSHYTVEIVAANGRLRYEKNGAIIWQAAESHPTIAGYRELQDTEELILNDMNCYQWNVAEQLHRALTGIDYSLCEGDDALETQQWIEKVIHNL